MWRDLCSVGQGPTNEQLARLTVDASETVPSWMTEHGAQFQLPLAGTLHLGRTNTFFLGGGKALINSCYRRVEQLGIPVLYEATVTDLELEGPRCTGVVVQIAEGSFRLKATSVVAASGGFEANIDWVWRYWGDAALNYHIRGPRTNDGSVLSRLLDAGVETAGEERGFHSVAVDARSPKFDGGIATRIDSIPFGVVLNACGERFYDEGEDIWPKRYAIWGRNVALQPEQIAYAFWDSKVQGQFVPPMYGTYSGASIAEVAAQLGLDAERASATIADYNRHVPADALARFDPSGHDGVAADSTPPKSNWALSLDTPPFYGIPMRPGITFTYMGVQVDANARIQRVDGPPFENVFAAGEIMSGNILSTGYMAGFGMTIGTVWGRIAGREAARHGRRCSGYAGGLAGRLRRGQAAARHLQLLPLLRGLLPGVAGARTTGRPHARRRDPPGQPLCHDCRDCYLACMYTPPHEFGVNPPELFAAERTRTYERFIWGATRIRRLASPAGAIWAAVVLSVVLLLLSLLTSGGNAFEATSGSAYDVIEHWLLLGLVGAPSVFAVAVIVLAALRYWRFTHGAGGLFRLRPWGAALAQAATLRHQKGSDEGCTYPGERPAGSRLVLHQLVVVGFGLTFLATVSAAFEQYFLSILPPYPYLSVPVISGVIGGVAQIVGCIGLARLKLRSDRSQTTPVMWGADFAFLGALLVLNVTGLLVLVFRDTPVFGAQLVVHVAAVMVSLAVAPYTKFVHFVFRVLAIYQNALETPPEGTYAAPARSRR